MRSFSAYEPPGWAVIDLTQRVAERIGSIADAIVAPLAQEARKPVRRHLVENLQRSMTELAGRGAVACYMPVGLPTVGEPTPLITVLPVSVPEGSSPLESAALMLTRPGADVCAPPDMIGVKWRGPVETNGSQRLVEGLDSIPEDVAALGDIAASKASARRRQRHTQASHYMFGVPNTDRWMQVEAQASVVTEETPDDVLESVGEFFDAWVGTIRWEDGADD